jgi:hypothetical protein
MMSLLISMLPKVTGTIESSKDNHKVRQEQVAIEIPPAGCEWDSEAMTPN